MIAVPGPYSGTGSPTPRKPCECPPDADRRCGGGWIYCNARLAYERPHLDRPPASIPPDQQRPLRTRDEVERVLIEEALSLYPGGATDEERARVAAAVRRGVEESPESVEMLQRVSEQALAALRLVMRAELASSLRLRSEDP